jgi:hypothetical protein
MTQPPSSATPSIAVFEFGLTAIAVALAFALPFMGSARLRPIEQIFARLARRKGWAVASVGLAAFLFRLAILPLCPMPLPFVPDDFSFLLSGDTFALGRLTNPTPAMWTHFESIHISMTPTYMSMYFPATGLVLAAGKVLTGHAWFGLLVTMSLMCAAICWMLQAWLPPTWALLGGIVAILRIGLFSYWINTYHGGGAVSALGGALVLGAFPRLMKKLRLIDGLLLATGICLLMLNRPYEGVLLCLPVAFVLGRWIFTGTKRPRPVLLMRRAALPLALIVATAAWFAYYNYRAFGSPTTLPYTLNRNMYAVAPYFQWQPPKPVPAYRHPVMRTYYTVGELEQFTASRSPGGFAESFLVKMLLAVLFYAGPALFPILLWMPRAMRDDRMRFLSWSIALLTAGMLIQIYLIPHYLAPFTAAFYAIGLQAARHLRQWSPQAKPVGLAIVRSCVVICCVMTGARLFAAPLHLPLRKWPPPEWLAAWYGPGHFGTERAQVAAQLESLPGRQLVIVRYAPSHNVYDEWVYNAPDIDNAKVIWAREMSPAENTALIHFYKDRKVWLIQPDMPQPDTHLPAITPYTATTPTNPAAHTQIPKPAHTLDQKATR